MMYNCAELSGCGGASWGRCQQLHAHLRHREADAKEGGRYACMPLLLHLPCIHPGTALQIQSQYPHHMFP